MPVDHKDYVEPDNWLSIQELKRTLGVFCRLGIEKIRFTGGEPLLRRNFLGMVSEVSGLQQLRDVSLSTNGTQLKRYAVGLRQSGIQRLNVSLDTLDQEKLKRIVHRDVLDVVVDGLMEAKRVGFELIKINSVLNDETTSSDIDRLVGFCAEHGFVLRLIEPMPMGKTGRIHFGLTAQNEKTRLKATHALIDDIVPGAGPAQYLRSADGKIRVGFITPISQHFCEACNRLRLGADGTLYPCLGQNDSSNLRDILRSGGTDEDLENEILSVVNRKPERHHFVEDQSKIIRIMAATGG